MNDGLAKRVRRSKLIQSLPTGMIVSLVDYDPYYNHFTLRVKSLSEYIEVVSRLMRICKFGNYDRLVFRGHSDASSNYKLIPTIGRKKRFIEYCEENLVTEMLTLRPEEFSTISTEFNLLSTLQHFGVPTRLLDFTYNPLIALYFACCSKTKTDSRIVCTYDTCSTFNSDVIEAVCGMYKHSDYNAISLDGLIGGVSRLRHYARSTREPLMAKPMYANDRIKHQSAVFMIFPNAVCDKRSYMVVRGKEYGDEEKYRFFTIDKKESKRLEYIRKEPEIYKESFRVTPETIIRLFKHYENQFEDFYDDDKTALVNPKYHFLFQNRFSIENTIEPLSSSIIANDFVSIIIENKHRKKIIEDLKLMGIDKAFVFPELEYTAEMIRNKYF